MLLAFWASCDGILYLSYPRVGVLPEVEEFLNYGLLVLFIT
jgi:hypothetical protein